MNTKSNSHKQYLWQSGAKRGTTTKGQTTKLPSGREVIGEIPISVVQGSSV